MHLIKKLGCYCCAKCTLPRKSYYVDICLLRKYSGQDSSWFCSDVCIKSLEFYFNNSYLLVFLYVLVILCYIIIGVSSGTSHVLTLLYHHNKSYNKCDSDITKERTWKKKRGEKHDEDTFMKFVSEDIHQCALLTADSSGNPFFPRTTQILLEYQLGRWVPRLRQPRDLYGVSSSGPLSPTRWPYHCEVIDENIQHIDWTPYPEPVYTPTSLEMAPLYPNPKEGTVVYLAEDAYKEPYFVYSRVGGNRTPLKQPMDNYDNTLMFEARFESGNLQKVVKVLMEEREVILYCDLHGHSRKENIFMYGCDGRDRSKALYLQQRIFPLMLSKNCPDKFSFSACRFNIQKSKEGTGRVVMWKMGIRNSFTMEATFCGSTLGNKRGTHFNAKDLESMGYHFCDSLLDYCDPDRTKYYQCLKELEDMEKHINLEKIFDDSDTSLMEITLDLESSSRGSDSSESNDSQTYLLKLTSQLSSKKKYLKTKKKRNSTIARHKNARKEQEVYGRGRLQQSHKESNSNAKDTRPKVSENYIFEYFRREFPNQSLVKISGPVPPWHLKNLSSESLIQSLNKEQQRHFLENCERPIKETIQLKRTDMCGTTSKMKSLMYPVSKQTFRWPEKTKIPTKATTITLIQAAILSWIVSITSKELTLLVYLAALQSLLSLTTDLHHNLKSRIKECTSSQNNKTGINWTDDEKRIYRDKRIAQTQEMLTHLLPIMKNTKNMKTAQIKQIFNLRTNRQSQHQLKPATCINIEKNSTSWTPPRNLHVLTQRDFMTQSSEWFQSVPEKSFESLSPLKDPKNRKKHSGVCTTTTECKKPLKRETVSSSFEMDANVKHKNLQTEDSNWQNSIRVVPGLTEKKEEQPNKNDGQPTFHLKFQRDD
ncbi:cytosolic carboxypeptidase 3 isoform X10 [Tamandua tetradactyla]|uniref:cytosolic carboxypeptidase 3 isoform X10 n=1 Tax=Tamandua tetradactyla TaxID=48850 RepID=UPI0040548F84